MRRVARLLVAIAACFAVAGISGTHAASAADATTTAVIVIDTGGSVRAVTVDVGSGTSGLAALQRVATVATYGYGGMGGAVCKIDDVGNEATQSSCLVGPNGAYWAYFHSAGGAGAWSYSPVGAGSYTVHGGDVEGWRYGTGQKPGASPVFCDYVACPSPPPASAAPSGGSATSGGSSSASTGPSSASGSAGGANGAGASGVAAGSGPTDAGPSAPDATTPPTTRRPTDEAGGAPSARQGSVRVEAAGAGRGGGSDAGSPVGVLVAVGLLAVGALVAVLLRRRARAAG